MAAPASGQVRGRVLDRAGTSLAGAVVELWSLSARLGSQVTNSNGRFLFPAEVDSAARLVIVRRIGYRPERIELPTPDPIEVTMTPFALTLPTVAVTATPLCPNKEDRAARTLWKASRARYRAFRPGEYAWSDVRMIRSRVRGADLGAIDTSVAETGEVGAGDSRNYFAMQTRRVVDSGYAVHYEGLLLSRFQRWEYPWLESFFAGHFLDSVFGELHRFSAVSPGVVVFCPRSTKRPSIEGRLEFDSDTALVRATWAFVTDHPREIAGGEVLFARPPEGVARPMVVPLIGMFWRKLVFDYFQEWMEFREWKTCAEYPEDAHCR